MNKSSVYNKKKEEGDSNANSKHRNQAYVYNRGEGQRNRMGCNYCGKEHVQGASNCPAYGKLCCHKKNDFASVCREKEWEGKQDCKVMTTREECYWEYSHSHDDLLLMSGPIQVDRRGKRLLVDLEHEKKIGDMSIRQSSSKKYCMFERLLQMGPT